MNYALVTIIITELIIDIIWSRKYYQLVAIHKEVLHANEILAEKLNILEQQED